MAQPLKPNEHTDTPTCFSTAIQFLPYSEAMPRIAIISLTCSHFPNTLNTTRISPRHSQLCHRRRRRPHIHCDHERSSCFRLLMGVYLPIAEAARLATCGARSLLRYLCPDWRVRLRNGRSVPSANFRTLLKRFLEVTHDSHLALFASHPQTAQCFRAPLSLLQAHGSTPSCPTAP